MQPKKTIFLLLIFCFFTAANLLSQKYDYKPAIRVSDCQCPSGYDIFIEKVLSDAYCLKCPAGYKPVPFYELKSKDQCYQPAYRDFKKAIKHGRGTGFFGTDCKSGQFWDPNGYCWSCPPGYNRSVAHGVTSDKACWKDIPEKFITPDINSSITLQRVCEGKGAGHFYDPTFKRFDPKVKRYCWVCPPGYTYRNWVRDPKFNTDYNPTRLPDDWDACRKKISN